MNMEFVHQISDIPININRESLISNHSLSSTLHRRSGFEIEASRITESHNDYINEYFFTSDIILRQLLLSDNHIRIFFAIVGFYQRNDDDHLIFKVTSRLWQFCLLVLGSIGFFWTAILFGGYSVTLFFSKDISRKNNYDDQTLRDVLLFNTFLIATSIQVLQLLYTLFKTQKLLKESVNSVSISKMMLISKHESFFFLAFFVVFTVVIPFFQMNHKFHREVFIDPYGDDYLKFVREESYSSFIFNIVSFDLFYNLVILFSMTVNLFFLSLSLQRIRTILHYMISGLNEEQLGLDQYKICTEHIFRIRSDTHYLLQISLYSAGYNLIIYMMLCYWFHLNFSGYTVLLVVKYIPYLLKGILIIVFTCYLL